MHVHVCLISFHVLTANEMQKIIILNKKIFSYIDEELQVMDELMVVSQKDATMKQNSVRCYFQLNARCNHPMQLRLKVGDRFSTPVYITGSNEMYKSTQCIEVPCSGADDILITGNRITVNPPDLDLSRMTVFSSKEECKTSLKDEHTLVTVTCNQQINVETQGQYCYK